LLTKYYFGEKSRMLRWAGHVAPTRERSCVYRVLVKKPEGKDHLEDLGVDGRILLHFALKKGVYYINLA
jgi:hypothetical protein